MPVVITTSFQMSDASSTGPPTARRLEFRDDVAVTASATEQQQATSSDAKNNAETKSTGTSAASPRHNDDCKAALLDTHWILCWIIAFGVFITVLAVASAGYLLYTQHRANKAAVAATVAAAAAAPDPDADAADCDGNGEAKNTPTVEGNAGSEVGQPDTVKSTKSAPI